MKKRKITFDQVVAGALYKFGRIDSEDITLLINELDNMFSIIHDEDYDMSRYFISTDGSVVLNQDYMNKVNDETQELMLDDVSLIECLDKLDVLEFTLRKIKLLGPGCVIWEDIRNILSKKQLYVLGELYEKDYIMDYFEGKNIYDDYQAIKLTKRGEVYLYMIDNNDIINEFLNILDKSWYDDGFIEEFLMTQDLEQDIYEILTIENFLLFYTSYDRNTGKNGKGSRKRKK